MCLRSAPEPPHLRTAVFRLFLCRPRCGASQLGRHWVCYRPFWWAHRPASGLTRHVVASLLSSSNNPGGTAPNFPVAPSGFQPPKAFSSQVFFGLHSCARVHMHTRRRAWGGGVGGSPASVTYYTDLTTPPFSLASSGVTGPRRNQASTLRRRGEGGVTNGSGDV